ncbi:MAG: hypothetical protein DBX59_11135 [Bacillota bacterium]|nr:MAG: hypothetical protein DBX59_11135 [Bacillota bacterium]
MQSGVEEFLRRADELIDSKYIFADARLAGTLKAIAASPDMMQLIGSCLKDFDFEDTFTRSFVASEDTPNRAEYLPPKATKEMIALVFSVLLKIDSGEIDLGAFMKTFFYGDGSLFGSYALFTGSFVKPFRNAVKLIFDGLQENAAENAPFKAGFMKARKLPEDAAVDEDVLSVVKRLVEKDENTLLAAGLEESRLTYALSVLRGFYSALEESDRSRIKTAFSGYMFMSEGLKNPAMNAVKIAKILKEGKLV